VEYIGSVGPDRRDAVLGGAAALLHPINFDEPFGLSVVESMLCGTPVVAFNRGSMPELIEPGENGFLVDSVGAAVEAVGRIGEIDRATCRSIAARRFSVERMADDYIRVYEQILAERRGDVPRARTSHGRAAQASAGEIR
jgi:glycosyltransferase involved in cell wall biosynthesis